MDRIAEAIFRDKRPFCERLLEYGFLHFPGHYEYSVRVAGDKLLMRVSVSDFGEVVSEVVDTAVDEPYILHLVTDAVGEFTVGVRDEYIAVLSDIAEKCFVRVSMFEGQTERMLKYINEKYNDDIEYPWEDYEGGIVRRQDNGKWYVAFLRVAAKKFFPEMSGKVNIVNIKVIKGKAPEMADGKNIFPAYHMNKQNWISLILDDVIPDAEIFSLIDASYTLVGK